MEIQLEIRKLHFLIENLFFWKNSFINTEQSD